MTHNRQVLEWLGVVSPELPPRKRYDMDKVHAIVTESRKRHGYDKDGQRAHLQEMVKRGDIPPQLRGMMQMALNRHHMDERRGKSG